MKSFFSILALCLTFQFVSAQTEKPDLSKPDPAKDVQVVEVSCGECKFHMKGKGCNLAVRMNDKAYYVDGAGIDTFGDAHADDGFCNAIRKAEVQGTVVDNKFKVTYMKLLPEKKN